MIYLAVLSLLCISVKTVNCETKAKAILQTETINGTIYFEDTAHGVHVTGAVTGLPVGLYGFHVHEIGNVTTCDASGPHFNPESSNHGGRDHSERHVGDLGNLQFSTTADGSVVANINFLDNVIALNGTNNIIGRTLVLHAEEDDLGLGGHETSLTTGNAGPRVACAIIRQVDQGNSVGTNAPSLMAFTLSIMFMYVSRLCST